MTRPMISAALLVVALAGATRAQTYRVWPAGYDNVAGGNAQEAPFSISRERLPLAPLRARSAVSINGATLPFQGTTTVTGLAFRRDAVHGASYPAQSGHALLYIGTIPNAEHTTGAFNRDWRTQSLAMVGTLNLPNAARPGSGAAPFNLRIPFQLPWVYPGGDLRIDLTWTGTPGSVWRRDAVALGDRLDARFVTTGLGCPGSNGHVPYAWIEPDLAVAGGALIAHLEGAVLQPGLPALELLGTDSGDFSGVPLPIPLSLLGMPAGCSLHTDIVLTRSVPLGARSTFYSRGRSRWPIPASPVLVGASVSTQWLVPDPMIGTPLPLTTSNGLRVTIGAPIPPASANYLGRTAWKYGAVGAGNDGGVLSPRNYVPVIEFEVR